MSLISGGTPINGLGGVHDFETSRLLYLLHSRLTDVGEIVLSSVLEFAFGLTTTKV
jgi:hypothetical protein